VSPGDAELITESLEQAAEVCDDLTPLVYTRLFAAHPQMEPLFFADRNGQVRGEMLARVIEAILDFAGERKYAATLIQTEVVNHAGYDVPPAVFGVFFGTVADTLRDLIGAAWTADIDAAWTRLLAELDYYVTHPDQAQTAAG
jgi:hemoglobin-like flavoprotein